jgi:hypothetical protein
MVAGVHPDPLATMSTVVPSVVVVVSFIGMTGNEEGKKSWVAQWYNKNFSR